MSPSLSEVSSTLANSIKSIILDVVDFLTPIINIIAVAMIIFGGLLIALRQEFYGIRLILGGGIALIIVNLVIPQLLQFL